MQDHLTPVAALPADGTAGTLIGRVWLPGDPPGPAVVAIRDGGVFDLGRAAPTVSECCTPKTASKIQKHEASTTPRCA